MNTIDFRPNWAWLKFFSRSAQYIHAQYIQYTYNLYYDHTYLIVCSKIFQKLIYGIFSKIGIGSADSFHRSHIAILLFSNAIFLYKNENSKFILRFFFIYEVSFLIRILRVDTDRITLVIDLCIFIQS